LALNTRPVRRSAAVYFAIFSISLCLWSAQAIYARAFYAAGNTIVPMIAGTAVTVISLPIYAVLYRLHGTMGLAVASDVGITLQTLALAVLLHQRRMVSLASLDYRELGRCLVAGAAAGAAVWAAIYMTARWVPGHNRWIDLVQLMVGSGLWILLAGWLLSRLGSALPRATLKRLKFR
jgi:putative peptidoglycan lipid II flippase